MILFECLKLALAVFGICFGLPAVVWCLLGCLGMPRQAEDFRRLAAVVSGHYGRRSVPSRAPAPTGRGGRIATPVRGLVRNDGGGTPPLRRADCPRYRRGGAA